MRDAAFRGLAVGFFDGVHLGHQSILRGADAALTFRNHPLSALAPEKAPRLIMTPEERVAAIKACGVGEVRVLDFTRELAEMAPEDFVRLHVFAARGAQGGAKVFCGENWRFGKGGAGDAEFLRRRGVEVVVAPYVEYKGERISSSRIRACLERGEIRDANAMLGRRFLISGSWFQGKGVGTEIGYPTVNLKIDVCKLKLPLGVYVVEVCGAKAVANYGLAPTMGERAWTSPVLEIHLLGNPDNRTIRTIEQSNNPTVSFVDYLRPERTFGSVEELKRQIAEDCRRAEG